MNLHLSDEVVWGAIGAAGTALVGTLGNLLLSDADLKTRMSSIEEARLTDQQSLTEFRHDMREGLRSLTSRVDTIYEIVAEKEEEDHE